MCNVHAAMALMYDLCLFVLVRRKRKYVIAKTLFTNEPSMVSNQM